MPDFDAAALGTPNRGTGEAQLDQWNQAMRSSPIYQRFMQQNGLATDGRVSLSRAQQSALEAELRAAGFNIPSGMHIDQGGNLNQKNRLGRNVAIGAAATGAALTGFGLAGMGPLSGLGGGAAAGSASVPGVVSGSVPTTGAMAGGLGTGTVTGGTLAATPFTSLAPYAGTAAASGAGAGVAGAAAAGAGSGIASQVGRKAGDMALGAAPGGMNSRDWIALLTSLGGTVGGALSSKPDMSPTSATTDPNMQKLIGTMQGRLDQSEPLYKSIMAMANGLLPTQYQNGGSGR